MIRADGAVVVVASFVPAHTAALLESSARRRRLLVDDARLEPNRINFDQFLTCHPRPLKKSHLAPASGSTPGEMVVYVTS
jgi:hypothetical protein